MNTANERARSNAAARLDRLAEHTNNAGRRPYEKLGDKRTLEELYACSLEV